MPKASGKKPKSTSDTPVPYETAEALDAKCREYVDQCRARALFPDEAGLFVFVGLDWDAKARFEGNEAERYPGFATVLRKYQLLRESELSRMMLLDPKLASPCAYLLKQAKNGGYADKQQAEGKGNVTVEFKLGIPETEA